jgi:hypothetical protein
MRFLLPAESAEWKSDLGFDAVWVVRRGRHDEEAQLAVQEQSVRLDVEAARGEARAHALLVADRERRVEERPGEINAAPVWFLELLARRRPEPN